MIVYFSGTGNSKWAAEEMAFLTGDRVYNIRDVEKFEDDVLGIVFPIYAWGMPTPMSKFLKSLNLDSKTYIYMVCTCGSNCGYADKQVESVLKRELAASLSLALPNNYIQGGNCDDDATAKEKFGKAKPLLREFAGHVRNREKGITMVTRGPLANTMTDIVHPLFLKISNSGKAFNFTDACISCGKCALDCPTANITLISGHPSWGSNCCECTACINNCPVNAIKYGKHDRRTYHFKEEYVK